MLDRRRFLQWLPVAAVTAGCATMGRDPVQVQVVGVEPLDGEGMELRFLCKLRVQNPNDTPIEFNGIYLDLQVAERLVGEHDAPAEGVVGAVALDDDDLVARVLLLHEQGEVQARGAAADADDLHIRPE